MPRKDLFSRVCADCPTMIRIDARRCKPCSMRHRWEGHLAGSCRACRIAVPTRFLERGLCERCAVDPEHGGEPCELDGILVGLHPRCSDCTALTGPRHLQRMTPSGACTACVAYRARNRATCREAAS